MHFYLGAPEVNWLKRTDVPLFISQRRVAMRKRLPRALGRWALDSGGFTELGLTGKWETTAKDYAAAATRYAEEIGGLDWAAPQDWMCEPEALRRTGRDVAYHQAQSIASVLELRALAPTVHWVPVVQGWRLADYLACVEQYDKAGLDLRSEPCVGIGSVCRRQGSSEGPTIVARVAALGLSLHGFGFKTTGLETAAPFLLSADSMAWSSRARFRSREGIPSPIGCAHGTCASCLPWALAWREELLADVAQRAHERALQIRFPAFLPETTPPCPLRIRPPSPHPSAPSPKPSRSRRGTA